MTDASAPDDALLPMNIQDLLPDPQRHFGSMVAISGHIVVTPAFSYLVAHRSNAPQPALLVPGSRLSEALLRDGRLPCRGGTEVLFAVNGTLSGLLTFAGSGLFLARLLDLTTVTLEEAPHVTVELGPDLHTQFRLLLRNPGPNRLLVSKLLRSHLSIPLGSVSEFLSPGHEIARGLKSELQPIHAALAAAGASLEWIAVKP